MNQDRPNSSARGAADAGQALPSPRRADQLCEWIFQEIATGHFPEGARLPSEVEIGRRFGVSRPVVREALARLSADGIIRSRRGSGSYVLCQPQQETPQFLRVTSIADLMRCFEYRIAVEGEAAFLAARRRLPNELRRIREAQQEVENSAFSGEISSEADLGFHCAVAEASGNSLFVQSLEMLRDSIAFGMDLSGKLSRWSPSVRQSVVCSEHRKVCSAIEAGEPENARMALRAHVEHARRRMLGELPADDLVAAPQQSV